MTVETPLKELDERGDVVPQPYAPPGFLEMLTPHTAKLGIVPNEVRKLSTLLHQIAAREPFDFVVKMRRADQLAQDETRIIETQRLIEV